MNVKRAMLRPDEIVEENYDLSRAIRDQFDSNRSNYRLATAIFDEDNIQDTKKAYEEQMQIKLKNTAKQDKLRDKYL